MFVPVAVLPCEAPPLEAHLPQGPWPAPMQGTARHGAGRARAVLRRCMQGSQVAEVQRQNLKAQVENAMSTCGTHSSQGQEWAIRQLLETGSRSRSSKLSTVKCQGRWSKTSTCVCVAHSVRKAVGNLMSRCVDRVWLGPQAELAVQCDSTRHANLLVNAMLPRPVSSGQPFSASLE